MKPPRCARKAEVLLDEPIDFVTVDDLLTSTREAVRRAAEVIRQSQEIQELSRALRRELKRELRRAPSPRPRPHPH
jgi:hypothetical protein